MKSSPLHPHYGEWQNTIKREKNKKSRKRMNIRFLKSLRQRRKTIGLPGFQNFLAQKIIMGQTT
jgi:hypothetical protein